MAPSRKKWIGERFGMLIVSSEIDSSNVEVLCDCGESKIVRKCSIRTGYTKSCGCLRKETARVQGIKRKYKCTDKGLYTTYCNMLRRCTNPTDNHYKYYGGRGISVCSEWKKDFDSFAADMGIKPFKDASIERIDVNGNYCKENCKWIPLKDQGCNTRRTVWVYVENIKISLAQACKKLNLNYDAVWARISRGTSPQKAIEVQYGIR